MPLVHLTSGRRPPQFPSLAKKRDPERGLERESLSKRPGMRTEIKITDNTDMNVDGETQVSVQQKFKAECSRHNHKSPHNQGPVTA